MEARSFIRKSSHGLGGWGNGYVVIPPGHPAWQPGAPESDFGAHGGITFAEIAVQWHVDNWGGSVKPDDIGCLIIGFDTCHWGDDDDRWTKEAVQAETDRLLSRVNSYTTNGATKEQL